MSVIQVNQIKASLEKEFASSINLEDVEGRSKRERENTFLSRSLAALAIKILTGIPSDDAARSVTDGWNDNGLDAIYYHRQERILYLVQAKWKHDGRGSIERGEAQKFIKGSRDLVYAYFDRFNDKIRMRKREIEDCLKDAGTEIILVVVHTGQQVMSDVIRRDFQDCLDEFNDTSEVAVVSELRGSADRSRTSGRTIFPAVASPALPDEPTHDDDHLGEGHPKVDHPSSPLRAPHQLLVGVVPGTRPLYHPALRCLKWGRLPLSRDLCEQSTFL